MLIFQKNIGYLVFRYWLPLLQELGVLLVFSRIKMQDLKQS